jgi:glutathione S-transferase
MRTLYHFTLCPFSRQVRIILKEKDLPFELVPENYWEHRPDFARLNPAMEVPVLIEQDNIILAEISAISEYLDETQTGKKLMPENPLERAEVRRLVSWFNTKFYQEVTRYVLAERVIRYFTRTGTTSSDSIRAAKANIYYHLDYIAFLTRQRKWLAGEQLSLADIAAASQLSVLDYLGDVPWEHNPAIKEWYALIKSRPSFRPLLADRIAGFPPAKHYTDLDF